MPRTVTRAGTGLLIALLVLALAWATAFHTALAIVLVLLVAGLVAMLTRPDWLLVAFVATQPWEHALAFPTAQITFPKLLGVALLGSWFLQNVGAERKLRWAPNLNWAVGLLVMVLLSFMLSPDPGAGAVKTISYVLYVVFAFLFLQLAEDADDVRRVLRTYTLAAAAAAGYSLIGFLGGHGGRASGPVADPNDFAFILAVGVPFSLYFLGRERPRALWAFSTMLLAGGILATFSRGAILGLLAVAIWGLMTGRVPFGGVFAGFAAVLFVGIVGYRTYQPLIHERLAEKKHIASTNASSREVFWGAALRMAEAHPAFGIGPRRFGVESENYLLNDPVNIDDPVVHNGHLEILAEDGVLALAAWIGMIVSGWRLLSTTRRKLLGSEDDEDAALCTALQASLLCSVVAVTFLSDQLTIPIWLITAMAGALALRHRVAAAEPELASPRAAARSVLV